ncbi:hypothetical protein BHM03_00018747 [Ensete ventricosum]|nr:hypothetical protein BHM03_00018747 [Ensete ventricosum]
MAWLPAIGQFEDYMTAELSTVVDLYRRTPWGLSSSSRMSLSSMKRSQQCGQSDEVGAPPLLLTHPPLPPTTLARVASTCRSTSVTTRKMLLFPQLTVNNFFCL